ncbi:hypothetical protein GCM10019016_125190 [Streptomyces prasinosporus]|uniref:Uncharacterized protein n=1 Tax=Streptomyces prasinosporus TaxID=68256 RepID=A0ABP6UGQ9_9ACTN|nr:hypothetical protein GCM10010332_01850 [Streptomyces albogriseolus]
MGEGLLSAGRLRRVCLRRMTPAPHGTHRRERGRLRGMDVVALLKSASLLVPEETETENDVTVHDVWEYLAHDEWEVALGLLEELGDGRPPPAAFWASMAAAAEELRLERSAAWCHWREGETRNGVIRADLTLRAPSDGGRRSPADGAGVLRRCGTSATAHRPANRSTTSP